MENTKTDERSIEVTRRVIKKVEYNDTNRMVYKNSLEDHKLNEKTHKFFASLEDKAKEYNLEGTLKLELEIFTYLFTNDDNKKKTIVDVVTKIQYVIKFLPEPSIRIMATLDLKGNYNMRVFGASSLPLFENQNVPLFKKPEHLILLLSEINIVNKVSNTNVPLK